MSDDLFRKEAIEFATQRLYGHVVILPKVSHAWALLFVVVCVALLIGALLIGTRIERLTLPGELHFDGAGGASVQFRLPPDLPHKLVPGETLSVNVLGFREELGRMDARVVSVSARRSIAPPSATEPGRVYVPAIARIEPGVLERAGLPDTADTVLPVETTVVTRRETWMRWLLRMLGVENGRA